jgi:bacteriorhodopsin
MGECSRFNEDNKVKSPTNENKTTKQSRSRGWLWIIIVGFFILAILILLFNRRFKVSNL